MIQQRQSAHKVWIGDLLHSTYLPGEGEFEPHLFLVREKKISRVNIIATVVNKYQSEGYSYLDLDDGSGSLRAKFWAEDIKFTQHVNLGHLVLVVGKCRKFNNEIYIQPELIRILDNPLWAKLRKIELEKEYGSPQNSITESLNKQTEDLIPATESSRRKLLQLISQSEEIAYDQLIKESGIGVQEVDSLIKELIMEGEIYMPRPGIIRII